MKAATLRKYLQSGIFASLILITAGCVRSVMSEARKCTTIDQAITAMGKPSLVHKVSESLTQYSWYRTVTVVEKDGEKRDYSDGIALYADAKGAISFRLLIHYPHGVVMSEGLQCFLPVTGVGQLRDGPETKEQTAKD